MRSLAAAAVSAVLGSAATACWAQSAASTIEGHAPPGAEVTAVNLDTGLQRHARTGDSGQYALVGLPAGRYRISAGPGTTQTVTLNVATTVYLDLSTLARVTVYGRRLVAMKSSEVGTIVTPEQIRDVPQLTRNFLEFADSVPGVIFDVNSKGAVTFRGGAQPPDAVNIYIDGIGQKGYVRGGQAGQTDGSQGNPFPELAIQEYRVITSNYEAEYGQLSSAAIVAKTKSGTNTYAGDAFYTYGSGNWRAYTPGELNAPNGPKKTESQDREFGADFGGPILRNKAHFYFAYEGKRYETPATVAPGNSPTAPPEVLGKLPASVTAQFGPQSIPFTEDLFFGKLDYEPTDDDRLELEAKLRDEHQNGNIVGIGTAESANVVTSNTDRRIALHWEHAGKGWFNEAILTYENAFFRPHGINTGVNGADYTFLNGSNDALILNTNGVDPRATQNKGQKGWSLIENLTIPNVKLGYGEHTFKTGVVYKMVTLTAQDAGSTGNYPVFFYDVDPITGTATIPYKAVVAVATAIGDQTAVTHDRQFGLYAQDDWTLNRHWLVNLGVRWDIEWNPSYLDWVTPQRVLDVFASPAPLDPSMTYGQFLASGSGTGVPININDYLSNGHNRSVYLGEIQPRLGFSYDVRGDQKYVVFGGYGRSYDRDLYDYLQLEQTKIALSESTVMFDTVDHPCTVGAGSCYAWNPAYLQGPQNLQRLLSGTIGEVDLMNNRLEVPYSDQLSIGLRSRLGDWNTSAVVSRVIAKNGFVFEVGNRGPGGAFYVTESSGQPGGTPWTYTPPGVSGNLILGTNGIESRMTQVTLYAGKDFSPQSKWGATFALTYSDATTNQPLGGNFTQSVYAATFPTIQQYPLVASNAVPRFRFVATGTLGLPWDVVVGGKLTLATPLPDVVDGNCLTNRTTFSWGGNCTLSSFTPPDTLGYRSLDLQATKSFSIRDWADTYVRLDVLNLLNAANYLNYTTKAGPNGTIKYVTYNPTGDITGVPLTVRLTVGARF